VRVTVRLFAGLRERAGTGLRELELPDGTTVGDVYAALALGEEPSGLSYAVNREYAERGAELRDGDEVALLTPVSGGAAEPLVLLGPEPIDLGRLIAHVSGPDAGAIATFTGTVRDSARDREVLDLEYEAYPGMAEQEIARIARAVLAEHGCLRAAICTARASSRSARPPWRSRSPPRTGRRPSPPASRRSTRSS
jgi:molybdopterin converting factor small subunit